MLSGVLKLHIVHIHMYWHELKLEMKLKWKRKKIHWDKPEVPCSAKSFCKQLLEFHPQLFKFIVQTCGLTSCMNHIRYNFIFFKWRFLIMFCVFLLDNTDVIKHERYWSWEEAWTCYLFFRFCCFWKSQIETNVIYKDKREKWKNKEISFTLLE